MVWLQVVLHHVQGIRDTLIGGPALDSAQVEAVAEEPSHPFHRSNLPSIEWFPATGRDWRSCCCSWSPRTKSVREKRRQACGRGSGLPKWRCPGGSHDLCPGVWARLALRLSSHFEGLSLSLSFFSVSFCSTGFCTAWRPHCVRSSLLHVIRRGGCRQGDAPLDQFLLSATDWFLTS